MARRLYLQRLPPASGISRYAGTVADPDEHRFSREPVL
jgi:hypothetical protein